MIVSAHARPRLTNGGLTLMEILVVLVIVAIVAGFAVLSTTALGSDPPQEKAARRIAALVELVSENAVMESKQFGIRIERHGYQFLRYDGANWKPVTDDPTLRKRKVDDSVTLRLHLEGREVKLPRPATALPTAGTLPTAASTSLPAPTGATSALAAATATPADDKKTPDGPRPQILALSSGEITPFKLEVAGVGHGTSYEVRGHMNGKIELIPPKSKVLNR
jgi:general secretion pathway protein H